MHRVHLLGTGAMVVVPIGVVTPPSWEGNRGTASTENRKRQDEENAQTGSVECTGDQVRVVLEDTGAVVSEVELDEKATDELAENNASLR